VTPRRVRIRALAVAGVCLAALVAPGVAGAQAVELDWEAPAGCPDETTARAWLDAYLGGEGGGAEVDIEIAARGGDRFAATIDIELPDGIEGERALTGQGCRHVAEAAVLVVAMIIDPAGVAARVTAAREAEPEPADTTPPEPLRLALGLRLLGDAGTLPDPSVGAGLFAGLDWARLHGALRLDALWPRTADGPASGSGGEFTWLAAGLGVDYDVVRALDGMLGLGPRVGVEGGVVLARGVGLDEPQRERQPWIAGGVGLGARLFGDAWWLGLAVEAWAPLHRPAWALDDFGTLFRPSPVGGRLVLDGAWRP